MKTGNFICIRCGKRFKASPSAERKFCSRACHYRARTGEFRFRVVQALKAEASHA